jgi:two-component system, NarL family, invasion response regulator UvrY
MKNHAKQTASTPKQSLAAERHSAQPARKPLRILIADDHAIVRKGLKQVLLDEFGAVEFGEACNGREALAQIQTEPWDVALLDVTMPGPSGLDVLKQLKELQPSTRVLVLSMHPEDQYAVRVLKGGASGYLTKNTASERVAEAVKKVLDGGTYVSASLAESLAGNLNQPPAKASHEKLSDREFQILGLIAGGKSVKEIAYDLSLSVKTVSTYRTRLLHKLKLSTTAELIRYALREGLIE